MLDKLLAAGDREEWYTVYREYYDGDHDTQLTDRQREYLQIKHGEEFRANYCCIVVDALVERLHVDGFTTGSDEAQSKTLWDWWKANRMDHQQGVMHHATVRDGDGYLIVDWDNENERPRFTYEPAYDGTEGVRCHYSNDQRDRINVASKRWKGDDDLKHLNLYYPDRIEKYAYIEGSEDEGWFLIETVEWLHADGTPMGIPVFHFRNNDTGYNYGASELRDIIPMQNALNKAIIDLVAAADTTAFRIYWMLGDDPSSLNITPGCFVFSEKDSDDVEVGYWPGEDLTHLIEFKDAFAIEIARISRTPISYFQISKQRAAEGTLKQEEAGLVARAKNRMTSFGNSWEDAMAIARRLWNTFGGSAPGDTLNENQQIETVWRDPETRNELAVLEGLSLKRRELAIPVEKLWREAGYSPEDVNAMKDTEEYKASMAMQRMALTIGNADSDPEREPS